MRDRIRLMRKQLVEKIQEHGGKQDFSCAGPARHVLVLGPSAAQVDRLREEHGVYAAPSGRICVAALNSGNIDKAAKAIAAVL